MTIGIAVSHRLDNFRLDVAFESSGRLTAVFGASGSGKTSLINVVAGLIRPHSGKVRLDGHVLVDTERGICLPAHRRRIGYVFQDARLFPHMTVEQNLAYGQWFAPRSERYANQKQIVDILGIGSLLARRPSTLSGGERQRVAIGRALLASPRLLLMDEPLASLDQSRKEDVLPHIETLRDELQIPIIYVSHSLAEVTRLATHVAVLSEGQLAAFGPTPEILSRLDLVPPTEHEELGTVMDMTVDSYDPAFRMTRLRSPVGEASIPGHAGETGHAVRVRIRARDVMIATVQPLGISALNIFHGKVASIAEDDDYSVYVNVDCDGAVIVARVTRLSRAALHLAAGSPVFLIVKALSLTGAAPAPRVVPA